MHAAKLKNSDRLMGILNALRRAGTAGMTTRELQQATGNCNPHSDVAEIEDPTNAIGGVCFLIRCVYEGTVNGRRINRYTLMRDPELLPPPEPPPVPAIEEEYVGTLVPAADCLRAMREALR